MKVHDLALRADYEIASKEQEYFFELDVSHTISHTLTHKLYISSFHFSRNATNINTL